MENYSDGNYTTTHTEDNQEDKCIYPPELTETSPDEGHAIKNFVLKWGRNIIDILVVLGFMGAGVVFLIGFIGYIKTSIALANNPNRNGILFIYQTIIILLPLIMVACTIISNYFLYLLIDMRDSLKKLSGDKE